MNFNLYLLSFSPRFSIICSHSSFFALFLSFLAGTAAVLEKMDIDSAVVMCRCLLEAHARNYVSDHTRYVNNTPGRLCSHNLTAKTSVSEALDPMEECCGQLKGWKLFKSNNKLFASASGRSVYSALFESVHTEDVRENQVKAPA